MNKTQIHTLVTSLTSNQEGTCICDFETHVNVRTFADYINAKKQFDILCKLNTLNAKAYAKDNGYESSEISENEATIQYWDANGQGATIDIRIIGSILEER